MVQNKLITNQNMDKQENNSVKKKRKNKQKGSKINKKKERKSMQCKNTKIKIQTIFLATSNYENQQINLVWPDILTTREKHSSGYM